MSALLDLIKTRPVFYDGSMGATILNFELTPEDYGGQQTEGYNDYLSVVKPDVIRQIHASFLEAGADVLETNTFGSSVIKSEEYGLGAQAYDINRAAADLARSIASVQRFVMGSIGLSGLLPASEDPMLDNHTFREVRDLFVPQIRGLIDGGVDGLIIETVPEVNFTLGISNVSFGINPAARKVINAVFLNECIQAGLTQAIIHPSHVLPLSEIPKEEVELAQALVLNRREDALQRIIEHYEGRTEDASFSDPDPMLAMGVRERLHHRILQRKKEGIEADIDLAVVEANGDAVDVLNNLLLPAMKEVGDKFGAGELILPFVLQSAETMKKAVKQLENYLEKQEGTTKGTVVLATVYGDVHDIGKNLVNTILSNNGYTVLDLGKQMPIARIIDAAVEHNATAIGLGALLVSTSKQMPLCVAVLLHKWHKFPVMIGGAAINPAYAHRALFQEGDAYYEAGVFYAKDAFEGLSIMDQIVEPEKLEALRALTLERAYKSLKKPARESFLNTANENDTERRPANPTILGGEGAARYSAH